MNEGYYPRSVLGGTRDVVDRGPFFRGHRIWMLVPPPCAEAGTERRAVFAADCGLHAVRVGSGLRHGAGMAGSNSKRGQNEG
jgi:hypothetical protein